MTKRQRLIVDRLARVVNWLNSHFIALSYLRGTKPIEQLGAGMERLLVYLPARDAASGLELRALDRAVDYEARQIRFAVTKLDTVVSVHFARNQRVLDGWKNAKRMSPPKLPHRKQLRRAA